MNEWLGSKFTGEEKNLCRFMKSKNYGLDLMSENDGIFCLVIATCSIKSRGT